MLFNKERRTPAIAAAAYYTIHQTQNDPVLAPVEAPLVEPIADAIKSVDETPYDPGEVFLLSPENQKKQMTKNPNYRVVDTNSEEDPYGIVRRAANYHKEIHGEVPVYEYIADSDTTIKRSNLIPVGTLPLGEYTPELPHAGSYNSVLYYNASNDKLYQRAYDLNDYGPTDTKDKGASSMDEKMNIMPQYSIPSYKYGGIHIKKKNRGKFTKSAKAAGQSVQEHAHSVMNNPKASTL